MLGIWHFYGTQVDGGFVKTLPNATVTVRRESDGGIAALAADIDDSSPGLDNPFTSGDDGEIAFYADASERYRIDIDDGSVSLTLHHQAVSAAAPTIAQLDELSAPASDDYMRVSDTSDSDNEKKITLANLLPLRGHLYGLTVANNSTDGDHDLDIAIGEASSDDTDPVLMKLSSAITKRLDATFAEGTNQGGFASGESLPTSGTIHLWLIAKDDGTTDVFANDHATSALAPTLPTGFTYKHIIGSRTTDASANIIKSIQHGDHVWLDIPTQNLSQTDPGTSAITVTTSAPSGRKLIAVIRVILTDATPGSSTSLLLTALDQTDTTPTAGNADAAIFVTSGFSTDETVAVIRNILTNTSAQIRARTSVSNADIRIFVTTLGWIDLRD